MGIGRSDGTILAKARIGFMTLVLPGATRPCSVSIKAKMIWGSVSAVRIFQL